MDTTGKRETVYRFENQGVSLKEQKEAALLRQPLFVLF
jgi:hypothetical protein